MSGKRRLPVLQPKEDEGEPRPPWHWSVIGAVATLLGWIPLAMLAQLGVQRMLARAGGEDPAAGFQALSPGERLTLSLLIVLGPMLALAIAAFLGGLLIGRFGGAAGPKEATVAGIGAAGLACFVVALQLIAQGGLMNFLLTAVVVVILAALTARGGALVGRRLRARSTRDLR
jgi:tRNA-(ms[2]io[6]A)-hydroxylase